MQATIVVDLGFGDAGKGSLVDYYVRRDRASLVVRFNGGAQAAHNVVLPDGRHHTFSQFGSGTFVEGVRTHLSRFMLFDPVALLGEEKHLRQLGVADALERISIDPAAPVVTPFQRAANRLREIVRGAGRHGSCGMGIGETMADLLADPSCIIRAGDLHDRRAVREKLRFLQRRKREEMQLPALPAGPQAELEWNLLTDPGAPDEFADLIGHVARQVRIATSGKVLDGHRAVVFEGAQGVLLDEWYGFHPHTTWSTTTFANAMTVLDEMGYAGETTRVGAMRAYMTRHGPGPFVTEDAELTRRIPDAHNGTNAWQREFRVGWADLVMLRYALEVCGGVDELAVTCMDRLEAWPEWKVCCRYQHTDAGCFDGDRLQVAPAPDLDYQQRVTEALQGCGAEYISVPQHEYLEWIEQQLGYPVALASFGPCWTDKVARVPAALLKMPDP